jgi:hypothetical protein
VGKYTREKRRRRKKKGEQNKTVYIRCVTEEYDKSAE